MKYALLGDLHSHKEDTQSVLEHIDATASSAIRIGLGDLFECTISKKKAHKKQSLPLHVAAKLPYDFIQLLDFPSIIGNQELRIMQVTGQTLFESLPETMEIEGALLIHGHQFEWLDDVTPIIKKNSEPLTFFGHSHHSALFHKGITQPFKWNEPIHLTKKRYAINVGSVIFHREWCLYDADQRTITFMKV